MEKSLFSRLYKPIASKVVELRSHAGLTQARLARKLQKPPSFIAKIELGERWLDLLEFYQICKACGVVPEKALLDVVKKIRALERSKS